MADGLRTGQRGGRGVRGQAEKTGNMTSCRGMPGLGVDGRDSSPELMAVVAFLRELSDDPVDIEADTELLRSGVLDSLGVMSLMTYLEDEWAVEMPEQDFAAASLATPRAIA